MVSSVGKSTMAWPFQALSQSKEATENQLQEAIQRNEKAAAKNAEAVERTKKSVVAGEQTSQPLETGFKSKENDGSESSDANNQMTVDLSI